jgi:hypothetical protein
MNFILFILFLLPMNHYENPSGSIRGKIIDSSDQKPLSGITVDVLSEDKTVISDEQGGFVIEALPPGTYELYYVGVWYKPYKQEGVEIVDGEETLLHVPLIKYDLNKTFTLDVSKGIGGQTSQYYLKIVKPDSSVDYKILKIKPDPRVEYKIEITDPKE